MLALHFIFAIKHKQRIVRGIMNTVKQNTTKILEKEMDRKEFLKHVGIATLLVTGISGLVSGLMKIGNSTSTSSNSHSNTARNGYGMTPYGGTRNFS